MNRLEQLHHLRKLLSNGWCQNAVAKTRVGKVTEPTSPNAARWCVTGAVAATVHGWVDRVELEQQLADALSIPRFKLVHWNDAFGRTKEDVLALIDCAIDNVNKGSDPVD